MGCQEFDQSCAARVGLSRRHARPQLFVLDYVIGARRVSVSLAPLDHVARLQLQPTNSEPRRYAVMAALRAGREDRSRPGPDLHPQRRRQALIGSLGHSAATAYMPCQRCSVRACSALMSCPAGDRLLPAAWAPAFSVSLSRQAIQSGKPSLVSLLRYFRACESLFVQRHERVEREQGRSTFSRTTRTTPHITSPVHPATQSWRTSQVESDISISLHGESCVTVPTVKDVVKRKRSRRRLRPFDDVICLAVDARLDPRGRDDSGRHRVARQPTDVEARCGEERLHRVPARVV